MIPIAILYYYQNFVLVLRMGFFNSVETMNSESGWYLLTKLIFEPLFPDYFFQVTQNT